MVKIAGGIQNPPKGIALAKGIAKGAKADGLGVKSSKAKAKTSPVSLKNQYAKIYSNMGLRGEQIKQLWQYTKDLLLNQNKSAEGIDWNQKTELTEEEYLQLIDPEIVANRILDFAKGISGGDPSKIDLLEGAVIKGFKEAERILGELPQVSKKTFELVKEGFRQWREEAGLLQG